MVDLKVVDEEVERIAQKYPDHSEIIRKAYDFILEKHADQKRKSGEPYVVHPVSVAKILSDMNMDWETVVAGFLHDTLEDTQTTFEEIKEAFGEGVAKIVEGVTKISKFKFKSYKDAQAENFRKLILATAEDIRVVIVKLADRLHNMRTLHFLSEEKRKRISEETLTVYAPIAHRLGMWEIKRELEDLAFKYLYPAEYERVKRFVSASLEDLERYLKTYVVPHVKEILKKNNIEGTVTYRPKHLYSIWQKTIRKNISLEEVYDLLGVRVIVKDVKDCYVVLGLIHSLFKPVPGRFKDYISLPKPNLYQSLHTTVVGPKGKLVEFQIRTYEMHERAEKGIASHWAYKEGLLKGDETFRWLREMVENLQGSKNPREVLENLKRDLFSEEVFVFTPKGDLVVLPAGSTPVDFAYHIHTEIGDHCVGAKVNGRIVPLSYRLKSGDQVEIITHPAKKPSPDWLKFVVTSKAKSRIKHYIRQIQKERWIAEGKKILEKLRESLSLTHEELLRKIRQKIRFKDEEELLLALGSGKLSPKSLLKIISKAEKRKKEPQKVQRGGKVQVGDLKDVMFKIAPCCNPVPGDSVFGVVSRGKGVIIHEETCPNLKYILEREPERVFRVEFKPEGKFKTKIRVAARDRIGVLADITRRIAEEGSNIWESSTKITKDGIAIMDFCIDVKDKDHLTRIMESIKNVEGIELCKRLYG